MASRMQQDAAATVGGRMSVFSQAFRSRYMPKGSNQQP